MGSYVRAFVADVGAVKVERLGTSRTTLTATSGDTQWRRGHETVATMDASRSGKALDLMPENGLAPRR
jgi:hypothetical protein